MSSLPKSFLTADQYLELDRASELRHEFYDGEMVAMSGGTLEHNLITQNLVRLLRQQVRPRGCQVYSTEVRVQVNASRVYTFPDVVVTCGGTKTLDGRRDTILNPLVIVEVLSPSTERHDRTRHAPGERLSLHRRRAIAAPRARRGHAASHHRRRGVAEPRGEHRRHRDRAREQNDR